MKFSRHSRESESVFARNEVSWSRGTDESVFWADFPCRRRFQYFLEGGNRPPQKLPGIGDINRAHILARVFRHLLKHVISQMNGGNGGDGGRHEQSGFVDLVNMIQDNLLCSQGVLGEFVFEGLDEKKSEKKRKDTAYNDKEDKNRNNNSISYTHIINLQRSKIYILT
jgi:hypothetical protein